MGRYKRKKKSVLRKYLLRGLLVAAAVPGILATAYFYDQARSALDNLSTDAAVFSALYTVPDRTLENLGQRFSGQIDDPQQEGVPSKEDLPSQEGVSSPQMPSVDTEDVELKDSDSGVSTLLPGLSSSEKTVEDADIPEEYRGSIVEENMAVFDKTNRLCFGEGVIKNSTSLSDEQAQEYLYQPNAVRIGSDGPQVLIMHTHATESFEPYDADIYDTRHTWRSTDNRQNIVAAGEVMAQAIRAHGIEVLHDETQHDYPSYNGSYERSAVTIKDYLAAHPSIKVVLDVHRDAVQRDTTLVKPVIEINGRKAAQMMIISGCDDGTMGMPDWGKNFRFAAGMQDAIESRYQGLTRPIFFCYRKYNQDLTTGSLLLELGSHGNTLDEVLYTAQLAGDAIGAYLKTLSE